MTEVEWVQAIAPQIEKRLRRNDSQLSVITGKRLAYTNVIRNYKDRDIHASSFMDYETDILIADAIDEELWTPRIIIEGKCGRISTHDAITYSHKAFTHRQVHPYLRYGILLGNRGVYPLPGRLFRHGTEFDFMASWSGYKPSRTETTNLLDVLQKEVEASRTLEEMVFESRKKMRKKYSVLHKQLVVK